jgi:MFS superfamily sulfate permease-like transporter
MLQRLRGMRFDLAEASGSLGDLGTFIPLAVSMIAVSGLDAGTVLVFAGIFNVLTGLAFNQPVPVQPMKAIAAVAIAEALAPGAIAAAGFAAGAFVLILGVSGLVEWVEKTIPRPVVRGIQLGVGLKLAAKGLGMVGGLSWIALGAAAVILLGSRYPRLPSALIVFAAGLAVVFTGTLPHDASTFGWAGPSLVIPTAAEWQTGLLRGTLPQLPLTLLNSVIAVCALSADLYPGKGIGTKPMSLSVGLMNLGGCLFGAMPACHGSGGLAGQHRFGARTGGSVVMLGAVKIVLGVGFGTAAMAVFAVYPAAILGVLLVFAGIELATPARDCGTREAFFIAAATAAGILAVNTWVGFVIGIAAALLLSRAAPPENAQPRLKG